MPLLGRGIRIRRMPVLPVLTSPILSPGTLPGEAQRAVWARNPCAQPCEAGQVERVRAEG